MICINFFEKVRNKGFWLLDKTKGCPIKKHYDEIQLLAKNTDKIRDFQSKKLHQLIHHAINTTEFYKKFKNVNFYDFPIIQKSTLKKYHDSFVSKIYEEKNLISVTTSGSYGTPMEFYQTKNKKQRQVAEIIYFNSWAGFEVGMKHAFIGVRGKNKLTSKIQNKIYLAPHTLNESILQKYRNILKRNNIKCIIGYPSTMKSIAEYCLKHKDSPNDFNIKSIITTSEPLMDRELIETVFGCKIYNRYSTYELGVIAKECGNQSDYFHLNKMSYIIEVLKLDKDEPCIPGEKGRVVVTDLYSHAMPLIRYDTGDIVKLPKTEEKCSCDIGLKTIKNVEGRVIDIIRNTNGDKVTPFLINSITRDINTIQQFQFIQKGTTKYVINLIIQDSFDYEDKERFMNRLRNLLGKDADIEVNYVSEIPLLPSGKRKYIINELIHWC
ncbi:phenylacetate--CoA ligase family protein [Natranaerobius thermophilus]|uniref:Coenzyme F390 synthetase-like protein n=1 Tax=Natranaerobius thermophilus (strain ATCC BAA-1301 / DSM 18059 / JW/NM-WN-LF) TaxID=457570 RepID=B2A192_NATTJ|nr:phenylacetate--CoA ligase family protein [Natranaerobius thermophilus]ACB86086.1 Coenzyme F390 synthetase-like protein [Natranaerobius thermophilus JW/NM-WN-LF]